MGRGGAQLTYDGGYSTHNEALAYAAAVTTGPIVEYGCGYYSTPLLHGLAEAQGRMLYTLEVREEWLELFRPWACDWHRLNERCEDPGLVFIDDGSEARAPHLRESHSAQLVVIHDTEPESLINYPGMAEAMDEYQYRRDYTKFQQWATILSDTRDIRR